METYGKSTKALRILRTLQQGLDDSSPASALRPWHARSFLDSAVQRLSIALQRAIQSDQIRRSHVRRMRRGGVPADYYEPELLRFQQQLPYRRPLGCKFPVMGTRAAGGYVGMSES